VIQQQTGAGTECLIKVNCAHTPEDIMPDGFTYIEIINNIEAARTLLNSSEWIE